MRKQGGQATHTRPTFTPPPPSSSQMLEGGTHKGFAANPYLDWRNTATARIRKGLAMLTKNLVSGGQWHTQGFCKYLFPGLHFLATRTRTHARGFLQLAQKKGERGGHPIRFPFRFFHSPRPLDGTAHGGVKTARAARLTPCLRLYHTSGNHAPKRRNRAKEKGRLKLKQPSLDDFIRRLGKPSKP